MTTVTVTEAAYTVAVTEPPRTVTVSEATYRVYVVESFTNLGVFAELNFVFAGNSQYLALF